MPLMSGGKHALATTLSFGLRYHVTKVLDEALVLLGQSFRVAYWVQPVPKREGLIRIAREIRGVEAIASPSKLRAEWNLGEGPDRSSTHSGQAASTNAAEYAASLDRRACASRPRRRVGDTGSCHSAP